MRRSFCLAPRREVYGTGFSGRAGYVRPVEEFMRLNVDGPTLCLQGLCASTDAPAAGRGKTHIGRHPYH